MFEYVDLEDSFVLGWNFNAKSRQLVFDLEVSLWKGHQHYTKPLPNEYTCYKRAQLIFENVVTIYGLLSMDKVKYSTDPDGSVDYGNIKGFHKSGNSVYKFGGDIAEDFGEVTVECENVRLEFNNL